MELHVEVHPPEIQAKKRAEALLLVRIRNNKRGTRWYEGVIELPPSLSLSYDYTLRKARVRFGILRKNEFLEKAIRIYSSPHTKADVYPGSLVVFSYDKDGVVSERMEVTFTLKVVEVDEVIV